VPLVIQQLAGRLSRITSGGRFIPEIDGLRFVAIASVMLFHVSYALSKAYRWPAHTDTVAISDWFGRGALGVELFFVISGFILALPFAREFLYREKPVDLRKYYLRRLTRLEPPYILVLIIFYAAAWFSREPTLRGHYFATFLARLFYLYGLIYQDAPTVNGVTWSLEIEVQFYVLMPLLAMVFALPAMPRRIGLVLAVILLPGPAHYHGLLRFSLLSQLPLFIAGLLFADLYLAMQKRGFAAIPWNDLCGLAVFVLVLVLPISIDEVRRILPVMILIFLLFMFNGVWLKRVLSWKPVYIIGGMCYSIYLIHYPLISFASRWLAHRQPGMGYWPAVTTLTFLWLPVVVAIAAVFFVLVEHPCMDPAWPRRLWERIKQARASRNR